MDGIAPAVKPVRARKRVDPVTRKALAALGCMLPVVAEHVAQCVSRLSRCPQDARVVPVIEEGAPSVEEAVEPPSKADLEALHAAGERLGAGGLDDQMDVIANDRELDDAKMDAMCTSLESSLNDPEGAVSPQGRYIGHDPESDVQRKS